MTYIDLKYASVCKGRSDQIPAASMQNMSSQTTSLEHLFSASKVHMAVHFSSARVPEPSLHRWSRLDCVCLLNKRTTSPPYLPGWCSVDAQQGHGTLWAKGTSASPENPHAVHAVQSQEYAEALIAYTAAKECLSDMFFGDKKLRILGLQDIRKEPGA